MIGITSYGAYIPIWRLPRELIGKEWKTAAQPGEKAVASFDEDSITMAVAAATNCIRDRNRQNVDSLFFASTTFPYREKQGSTTVAAATDLRKNIVTGDYANSLRAATTALHAALDSVKAGSAQQVLVAAADTRLGTPRSEFEQSLGDGAAALLIGSTDVVAEIERIYSSYHEINDIYRADGEQFVMRWEDRFVNEEGCLRSIKETGAAFFKESGTVPKDFSKVIISTYSPRTIMDAARGLGFDPKAQLQDSLFTVTGITGVPHTFLMLIAALEGAKPGDRLLLINYSEGTDIVALKVTEEIAKCKNKRGVKYYLQPKMMLDYATYAEWRGLLKLEPVSARVQPKTPSASAVWRKRNEILRFYGYKCKSCGGIQYPPQRVCSYCRTKDNFEGVRLSDKKAMLFTYTLDNIAGTIDVPYVYSVIDFEGGGRVTTSLTDGNLNDIKIGMPVEMTFRKLYTAGGIHNYYWKCMPIRQGTA